MGRVFNMSMVVDRMNKYGENRVISTVIIVVVTIAIALAVAYWMGGLAAIFTKFEKIEIKSSYVYLVYTMQDNVTVRYQVGIPIEYINTGTISTSIDNILINGIPYDDLNRSAILVNDMEIGTSAPTGLERSGLILIYWDTVYLGSPILKSGDIITITIQTTGNREYRTSVQCP